MNEAWKRKWIAALLGGEYRQTTGVLRDRSDRFCCLGVLCDLVDPAAWQPRGACFSHYGAAGTLPAFVQNAVGLTTANPKLGPNIAATEYNDGYGVTRPHSFAEIADLIEKWL